MNGRLAAVAAAVPAGAGSVADVGAGDGQLARHLAAAGLRVVATERSRASFARLASASPGLDCRLGDGLSVLRRGEVEGLIVAGMGGWKIARVLDGGRDRVEDLEWLVLQPQQHGAELADWLVRGGFRVRVEAEGAQRGRSYTVLLVRPPT